MNTALVVITLVSVGTTAAVLLYAMRLLRDERERSEARVVALSEAIAAATPAAPPIAREVSHLARGLSTSQPHGGLAPVADHAPVADAGTVPQDGDSPRVSPSAPSFRVAPSLRVSPGRHVPPMAETWAGQRSDDTRGLSPSQPHGGLSPVADHGGLFPVAEDAEEPAAEAPLLFGAREETTSARSRLFAPLIGALIVAVAIGAVYVMSSRTSTHAAAAGTAPAAPAPLELLSLRHVRKGDTLTISGLVRNPPTGQMQAGVTAVVFLFDKDGTFLTSGRAPLDYQRLSASDESPFVVAIPKAGAVARYRVSFRTEKDVVPHIDRRAGSPAS